ncbi:hypothetical protein BC936DRAFT_148479, partial [Jimgerdemannia flammicorona]
VLGQIWCVIGSVIHLPSKSLADTRNSGTLNQAEFIIAMHYIARLMDSSPKSLPPHLPPAIYAAASGHKAPASPTSASHPIASSTLGISSIARPVIRHNTGTPPIAQSPITRQITGGAFPTRVQTLDLFSTGPGGFKPAVGSDIVDWDVTVEDKVKFDKFFDGIDLAGAGVVQGNDAVEFFQKSRLPESELAHIWDLADLQKRGRLSRDEFAVAMHLINRRLAGDPLPKILPPTLLPPSERTPALFPGVDLKRAGTIALPPSTGLTRQPTGRGTRGVGAGDFLEHQRSGLQPQTNLSSGYRATTSLLDEPDLLGDFDMNAKIANETNEIQSLQLQGTTVSAATNDLKGKHSQLDATLAALQAQKKEVAARTAEIRALYDSELRVVQELEATFTREQPIVIKSREEVQQAERALQAQRLEKDQLELGIRTSRAEAEELRRRVRVIQEETNALSEQLEKLRKESKQQSQFLDIDRRQVSTAEAERDKLAKSIQEAQTSGVASVAVTIAPSSPAIASTPKADNMFEFGGNFQRPAGISGGADPFQAFSQKPEHEDSLFARSLSRHPSSASTMSAKSPLNFTGAANPTVSPVQERSSSVGSSKLSEFDTAFADFSPFSPPPAPKVNDAGSWNAGSWNAPGTPAAVESPKPKPSEVSSAVAPPPPPPSKHFSDAKRSSVGGASTASLNSLASSSGKKPPAPAPLAPQAGPTSPADPFAMFSKTFEDAKKKKTAGGADFDAAFSEVAVSDFAGKFPDIDDFGRDENFGFEDDFSRGSFSTPAPASVAAAPVSVPVVAKAEETAAFRSAEEEQKVETGPALVKSENTDDSITDAEAKFPDLSAIEGEFPTMPASAQVKEGAIAKSTQEAQAPTETSLEITAATTPGPTSDSSLIFASSIPSASVQTAKSNFDDFEAAFSGTLSQVKVVSVVPSDFDAAFDSNFDVDFNPTFEAPKPVSTPSTSSISAPFTNNVPFAPSSPFTSASASSSTPVPKQAFGGFDFSDFETSDPAAPADLDSIFGAQAAGSTSQAGSRMSFGNAFSFEDSFGAAANATSTPASSIIGNPFGTATAASATANHVGRPSSPPPSYASGPSSPIEPTSAAPVPMPSAPPAHLSAHNPDDTDQVKKLLEFGFTREQAIDALERYDNDLQKATNFLADNAGRILGCERVVKIVVHETEINYDVTHALLKYRGRETGIREMFAPPSYPPLTCLFQRAFRPRLASTCFALRVFSISTANKNALTSSSDHELGDLNLLFTKLNQKCSIKEKKAILARHLGCLPLLRRIYDPRQVFNISSANVKSFIEKQAASHNPDTAIQTALEENGAKNFTDLSSLLAALSSRRITGNIALATVAQYANTHCRDDTQREMFYRVLDKNLKMGISVRTINSVFPESIPTFNVALADTLEDETHYLKIFSTTKEEDKTDWYASRKLDGVRCLTMFRPIDRQREGNDSEWNVQFFSRTGKEFVTLKKVEEAIRRLILADDKDTKKDKLVQIARTFLQAAREGEGFVFDGEICVLDSVAGDGEDERENFQHTMQQVRRGDGYVVSNPTYFVFDCLTMHEFISRKGERRFAERLDVLKGLIGKADSDRVLRVLDQRKVSGKEELDNIISMGIEKKWEGIILRKDAGYQGKRSHNLLKIKQWDDAEYIVKDVVMGMMRIPDTGVDTKVLSKVLIEHKGNKVGVGSGFSIAQRIRYAEQPNLILGKPITVRYFAQSTAQRLGKKSAEDAVVSLRFPTVKMVYEEGIRDA